MSRVNESIFLYNGSLVIIIRILIWADGQQSLGPSGMINFSAIKVRLSECVVKTLVTIDTKSLVLFTIDDDISVMQRSMCDICLCVKIEQKQ